MAWISVHESIDGTKLRKLYKMLKCSKFEAVGILNFLWFWGLQNAEKDGLILYVDREDIERYLYGVGFGCKLAPKAIMDALIATGWIDQVPNGIYIHDWEIWQAQWYKAQERREYDVKRKRESRKMFSESDRAEEEKQNNSLFNLSSDDLKNVPEKSSGSVGGPKYTPVFERFWDSYPRKIGKGEAYKKYKARRNDGYSDEELLTAARNYSSVCKKQKTDKEYIKHPKTFLSDSLPFLDYLPKKTAEQPTIISGQNENPFADWKESS